MFDETSDHDGNWQAELPVSLVPARHSTDPFACPCCANVFSEILAQSGVDLAAHGQRLDKRRQPVQGDVWLVNAKVHTMDENQPGADAMWVKDGRIAWIGQRADAPAEVPDGDAIDCQGKTVLPGFIDPHMHLAPLAMLHSFENVGPFRFSSTDDAIDHLRQVADRTPDGEWVVGRQFDPSLQSGPDYLTRDLLDRVSTRHPVFVYNASLHLAYCNSLALEIAGVDAATPDPAGAELGRDAQGQPNGVLKAGPAMALVARHNPHTRQNNVADACLDVFKHANTLGITLLCDQGTGLFQGVRELDLYQSLRDSQQMTIRFRYSLGHVLANKWDAVGARWGSGDEWLRCTGWKIVSDGSNQGRTGLQREAFLNQGTDTAPQHGIAYIEVDELNQAVTQRLREGWAVCVHANGDAAIDRVLDAYELAAEQGLDPAARRCRIEHCSILHDEQIERMAKLGISPSFLIGHVYYWGAAFID
ncbi:MAG: amidohydrolase, partial [Pseudomonadota bacterium]